MNVNELKEKIDFYIEHGHGDDTVVITLSDSSIGGRAYVDALNIFSGFDWENGQMRIEPECKIIFKEKDRDVGLSPRAKVYKSERRKMTVINCPICETEVSKKDKYCRCCGQRLSNKIKYKKMY